MSGLFRNAFRRKERSSDRPGLRFDRPLVLIQSDDWGRAGVRDRAGWEELRAEGLLLGEKPYDSYSLETAEDLDALRQVLNRHRDAAGRCPSMVMNFIMANLDFDQRETSETGEIALRPLSEGLPGRWRRPGLLEGYRRGVREQIFFPALHGLTHFSEPAVARVLAQGGERRELLRKLWRAQTAYIHWRMPWIGYEYWDAEASVEKRFLSAIRQRELIGRAAEIFRQLFDSCPLSACAPGYRANADSRTAWFEAGVRVAQNGPGEQWRPFLNENGMLFTFRTVEMEPAITSCTVESLAAQAGRCFAAGIPAVISTHSINFHSTIQDFRTGALQLLHEALAVLERKWPDLLYLNDSDLHAIATQGSYQTENGRVSVRATEAANG
jgi:hypothetical protein